ncbi:hypothetical protein BST61_g438 [Cercospora zeina]
MTDRRTLNGRPLSPLNEVAPDQSSLSAAASPPTTPESLPRRRRVFRRSSRSIDETRAESTRSPALFNPEAVEFVPTSRMSSKRKASSSARPSKNAASNARTTGLDLGTPDHPIIRAQDIFGTGCMPRSSSAGDALEAGLSALLDDVDVDEILNEVNEGLSQAVAAAATRPRINAGTAPRERTAFSNAMRVVRPQLRVLPKVPVEPLPCHSAIICSMESIAPTDEVPDVLSKLRYLPLCPKPSLSRPEAITKDTELVVLSSHRERINQLIDGFSPCRARWPDNRIPMEIFDLITAFLSRDDVKSMRLVNKDFEEKVSANLFASAVVPFNTELYDMIEEDSKAAHRMPRPTASAKAKGKVKAIEPVDQAGDTSSRGLHWQNAKDDAEGKVYKGHGLHVFQGFGPYFRRFGMSFEVAENQLARPPIKKELDHVTSYYGSYEWPHQQYTRFAGLAGLERTADETLRMKSAFSNLGRVQDLGLSIDAGLGWLNGPDMSVHARVFQRPSSVFGTSGLSCKHWVSGEPTRGFTCLQTAQRGPFGSFRPPEFHFREYRNLVFHCRRQNSIINFY